nr:MAG TPA: hypothetical protein [Bacteriophage sp.]
MRVTMGKHRLINHFSRIMLFFPKAIHEYRDF